MGKGKDKSKTNSDSKRKRNRSSPNLSQKPVSKRNKLLNTSDPSDSEGEGTDYFDAEDSDSDNHTPPPTMKFSPEDLATLSSKLAPLLIKELKQAFKEECLTELRKELGDMVDVKTKSLRDEMSLLKDELSKAKLDHDELAQYGRRMCLDI